MNTALEEFKNKFSPLQLNSFSGIQLLKLLAYPKKADENIKKQFKDIYEESYNSLKNELENGMVDYGSGSAGYDINFVLAYRKGEWYNKKRKISLEEAINIANNIRNELVTASKYLDSRNFDGFYDFVSASKSGLFNKGYTHKYLYILYPEYITFYHANSWQIYYKKCFKITNSKNYYDIEKYLLNTYPGCNVGEKSKEFMEKFGIPQKKKDMDNTMNDKDKTPLNQILYGPPGTGKTYNTIIEAMKVLTFEGLFSDWYLKIYCEEHNVNSKEKTLNDYINHLNKINTEFLKNDNIFRYYDSTKFLNIKNYILSSQYIKDDTTKNNQNSYYQHGLKRYEEFLEWLTYDKIKEKFNEYKALGQIEFVTFHQSYSYEEFVEGIKPDLTSGDLKYIREHGCFRRVCDAAKKLQENKIVYNFNYEKLSLYKILIPDENLYENCIENNFVAINWGDNINFENCKNEQDLDKIVPINYEHRKQCISQMNMFKLWIDKDLKDGKDVIAIIPGSMNSIKGIAKITGDYKYNENTEFGLQQRTVEWIKTDINIPSEYIYESKFVSPTITGMFKEKIKKDNLMSLLNSTKESKSKNAVLIIDEINRGNISKIFGELITLIEEDKRENLSVRLPYSKDVFTVPKNLYIIGTMNTSDRSIASIDIALRRRFKFKEIMPNSNLVADFNCNFKECFEILNKRISVLLDRDHQIGHSYFIEEKYKDSNVSELETIWFDSIIPLLNEYFYSDWEKLQALLGNAKKDNTSFIKVVENVSFAKEYSCEEGEMFDFNAKCDFKAAMQNAFGDKFRG